LFGIRRLLFVARRVITGRPRRIAMLSLDAVPDYFGQFTGPAPTFNAALRSSEGVIVGHARYALSPLLDRWYVYDLTIEPDHQSKGFGAAFLIELVRQARVPISPVQETYLGSLFWNAARAWRLPGLDVWPQISAANLRGEAARWAHLSEESDRLHQAIIQRLGDGEPWRTATGRGLESDLP